jgi:hypothetical protein
VLDALESRVLTPAAIGYLEGRRRTRPAPESGAYARHRAMVQRASACSCATSVTIVLYQEQPLPSPGSTGARVWQGTRRARRKRTGRNDDRTRRFMERPGLERNGLDEPATRGSSRRQATDGVAEGNEVPSIRKGALLDGPPGAGGVVMPRPPSRRGDEADTRAPLTP